MTAVIALFGFLLVVFLFGLAAARWGADSRDSGWSLVNQPLFAAPLRGGSTVRR